MSVETSNKQASLRTHGLLGRMSERINASWKVFVIAIPFVWLLFFFLAPFFIVAKISLAEMTITSPPFTKMIEWADGTILTIRIVFDNFIYIFDDPLYTNTYFNSLKIAAVSTVFCLLVGYPIAYGIVRSGPVTKQLLLFAVILPFWTSFLLRVYAWMGASRRSGHDQFVFDVNRPHRESDPHALFGVCRLCGNCLYLSPVHDLAAIRQYGKA